MVGCCRRDSKYSFSYLTTFAVTATLHVHLNLDCMVQNVKHGIKSAASVLEGLHVLTCSHQHMITMNERNGRDITCSRPFTKK
jgi:hypothetical protein